MRGGLFFSHWGKVLTVGGDPQNHEVFWKPSCCSFWKTTPWYLKKQQKQHFPKKATRSCSFLKKCEDSSKVAINFLQKLRRTKEEYRLNCTWKFIDLAEFCFKKDILGFKFRFKSFGLQKFYQICFSQRLLLTGLWTIKYGRKGALGVS